MPNASAMCKYADIKCNLLICTSIEYFVDNELQTAYCNFLYRLPITEYRIP